MKAQRGSKGIAVLILDPGASWGWVQNRYNHRLLDQILPAYV